MNGPAGKRCTKSSSFPSIPSFYPKTGTCSHRSSCERSRRGSGGYHRSSSHSPPHRVSNLVEDCRRYHLDTFAQAFREASLSHCSLAAVQILVLYYVRDRSGGSNGDQQPRMPSTRRTVDRPSSEELPGQSRISRQRAEHKPPESVLISK